MMDDAHTHVRNRGHGSRLGWVGAALLTVALLLAACGGDDPVQPEADADTPVTEEADVPDDTATDDDAAAAEAVPGTTIIFRGEEHVVVEVNCSPDSIGVRMLDGGATIFDPEPHEDREHVWIALLFGEWDERGELSYASEDTWSVDEDAIPEVEFDEAGGVRGTVQMIQGDIHLEERETGLLELDIPC